MSALNHLTKFSNETFEHWMAKATLFYLLRRMKHKVFSEFRVTNGYVDIVDQTTMTFYEIERSVSRKVRERKYELYRTTGYEIIVIDCSKMPDDLESLKDYIGSFVVPD